MELHGSPQTAADRLIRKVLAQNRSNQDNVTVTILGSGERKEPVTVRVQKQDSRYDDLVLPVAAPRRKFGVSSLLIGLVIAALVVAGGMKWLAKNNKPSEQQIQAVQKNISGAKAIQTANSSARKVKKTVGVTTAPKKEK